MGSSEAAVASRPLFPEPRGTTFNRARDGQRLGEQYARVVEVMADGHWRTLALLSQLARAPEASVSARLRDARHAGLTVERRRVRGGLHEYRVVQAGGDATPTVRTAACPHCGGTATTPVTTEQARDLRRREWHARCDACGAMGPAVESVMGVSDPRERACEAWRQRARAKR